MMKKVTTIGAACLAIALAATSPAMARGLGGGGGGFHGGGGGFHGGGGGGFHGGGARFAAGGFNGGGARFAGGGFRGGGFRDHGFHRGGFGPGVAAGLIAGSVIGAGAYGWPGYYDDYANGPDYYDYGPSQVYNGDSYAAMTDAPVADSNYCAQRYRSYDPGSGTYLGYDGLRHPCQ
jgi:BA14K-like protein